MRRRILVPTAVTVCLISACSVTPTQPTVSATVDKPSSVPTSSSSPAPCIAAEGSTTRACSDEEFKFTQSHEEDFRAAEATYEAFTAENFRLELTGSSPDERVNKYLTGEQVDRYAERMNLAANQGSRLESAPTVAHIWRAVGLQKDDSQITLISCVDATKSQRLIDGKPAGFGPAIMYITYFKRVDGLMRIMYDTSGQAASC